MKKDIDKIRNNFSKTILCRCCHMNILSQEIGKHYRTKKHIRKHEYCMKYGLYQKGMSCGDIYVFALEYKQRLIDE